MKYKRQAEVLKIIKEKKIRKHEQLLKELTNAGYDVTQATVSRDIKELGLVKIQNGSEGSYYVPASNVGDGVQHKLDMFSESVREISCAMHTIVIKTMPGMAPAVAASVDSMLYNDVLGTVAGDDALLIVCRDPDGALATMSKLKKIFNESLIK